MHSVLFDATKADFAPDRSTSVKIYNPRKEGNFDRFAHRKTADSLLYQIPLGSELLPSVSTKGEVSLGGHFINSVYLPKMEDGSIKTYCGYKKDDDTCTALSIADYQRFNTELSIGLTDDEVKTRIETIMKGMNTRKEVRSAIKEYLASHIGNFVAENIKSGDKASKALFSNVWIIISKDS